MSWIRGLGERLAALFRRGRVEREMAEEFEFHLEMETEKLIREGMSPKAARREARLRFGGVERMKERTRDERGTRLLEETVYDLRYAARVLRRNPRYTLVAALTLALGVGANSAIFSVVNGVLLKPLPYPDSDRLVMLKERSEKGHALMASYPNFADWREQSGSFEGLAAITSRWTIPVLGAREPLIAPAMGVSREFFSVLGVPPARGRPIAPDENRPGGEPVVVVSHGFWRTHLGGNPRLGELTVEVRGRPTSVVGVMPPDFHLLYEIDIWFPVEQSPVEIRNAHNHWVIGRLKSGVDIEEARAEMNSLAAALKEKYGDDNQAVGVTMRPLREEIVGDSRRALILLLGAAGLVLLVACTNVASTTLARGTSREREIAIRSAVGAGRGRIVRQLFNESLLIAAAGGLLAIGVALLVVEALRAIGSGMVPRLHEITLEPRVLAFTVAVALATALIFGLLPALGLSRDRAETLRSGTRTLGDRTRARAWRGLVGAEVALALILLVGAGLLVRSLVTILTLDTGFNPENVLTVSVSPPSSKYQEAEDRLAYYDRLRNELRSLPGVRQVGLVSALPLDAGNRTGPVLVPPIGDPSDPDEWAAIAGWRVADAGYFRALQIPLLRGRLFEEADREGAPDVAIVNEALARKLWAGENPVGKSIRALWDFRGEELTVVGVVAEARHWRRQPGSQYELYVPYRQRPEHLWSMHATARVNGDSEGLIAAARQRARRIDADVPLQFNTLTGLISSSLSERHFTLYLLGGFAALALLLSLVGIYGVVSYSVARRRGEIGIRLVLGSEPHRVRRLVQWHALRPVLVGTAMGLAGAAALTRVMQSLLFQVSAVDPLTFATVTGVLLLAGAAASYLPARRATRVDPMTTIRAE